MLAVVVLVVIAVVALLAGVHWYVWRRVVRDTTRGPGTARRVGTVALVILPVLSVGALVARRAGVPFWLERILAWPGYLWLAVLLYLVLALLVGEAVRAIWLRWDRTAKRTARSGRPETTATAAPVTSTTTSTITGTTTSTTTRDRKSVV